MKSKILSVLIAFAILISVQPPRAIASETSYTDNVKDFLSQLGINTGIDGANDDYIARDEFAAMVVRIMNAPVIKHSNDEPIFTDIDGSIYKDEIITAKKLGIVNGVTESEYMPTQRVSISVAAKMLVCALDYGYVAEQLGGFPHGYMSLAQKNGIFKGVNTSAQALTYHDACTLLYNTLFADKALFSSISGDDTELGAVKGKNLLTENFKLKSLEGIITTSGLMAKNSANAQAGKVGINDELFDTGLDTSKYFGCMASLWYNENKEVVAICKDSVNSEKVVYVDDIESFSDYTIKAYSENGKSKSYILDLGFTFMLNGKTEECNRSSFDFPDGFVTLINNDGDGDYDFVLARKTEYFVISSINTEENIVYDSGSALKRIVCKNDDDYMCSIEVDGKPAGFDELKKDMVLSVSRSSDEKVCAISASTRVIKGTVRELSNDGVITGSGEYHFNTYFKNSGKKLYPGHSYSFLIAVDGTITDAISNASADKYGILLGYSNNQGGLEKKKLVKMFTTSDKIEVLELSNDAAIYINGTKEKLTENNISQHIYELVKYDETNGLIDYIVTYTDYSADWLVPSGNDGRFTLRKNIDNQKIYYRSGSYIYGSPGVSFRANLIFVVPTEFGTPGMTFDDEEFYIGTSSGFKDETAYNVDVYDFDEMLTPGVLLVRAKDKVSDIKTPTSRATTYFVKAVSKAVDSEGDVSTLIKVLGVSEYEEYFIKDEVLAKLSNIPESGDIIRITTNKDGFVTGLAVDVDYTKTQTDYSININYGVDGLGLGAHGMYTLFDGRVYNNTSDAIVIKMDQQHPQGTYWYDMPGGYIRLELNKPKYIAYNTKTGDTYITDMSAVSGSHYAGDDAASRVILKTGYGSVSTVFIYVE